MSKGAATLGQKASNALYQDTTSDPNVYSDRSKKYLDAARRASRTASDLEALAYAIFGPDLIGSLAFKLDPLSQFRTGRTYISDSSRFRERGKFQKLVSSWSDVNNEKDFRNYVIDDPAPHPEFLVDESVDVSSSDPAMDSSVILRSDHCLDSTQKSRKAEGTDFGTLEIVRYKHATSQNGQFYKQERYVDYFADSPLYNKEVITRIRNFSGPVAVPSYIGYQDAIDSSYDTAIQLMNDNVASLVKLALPVHRTYASLYNLLEFKDLPKMMFEIGNLRATVLKMADELTKLDLHGIGKAIGNAYLSYKFGWESTLRSLSRLLSLPEFLSKKLNYLQSRNGKMTSGHAKLKFCKGASLDTTPTYSFSLPDWVDSYTEDLDRVFTGEVRCVCNSTIRFPKVAIPSIRDTTYRDLAGLNLTPSDVYNLIPWTWLIDWFTGFSDYLSMLEVVNNDNQSVNYGFMTVVFDETWTHTLRAKVKDYAYTRRPDGSEFEEFGADRSHDFVTQFSNHYQLRVDIASLEGVKSMSLLTGLSEDMEKILGALFAKFS